MNLFLTNCVDGGQFSMVTSLLDKYGCLPQAIFPESYNSRYVLMSLPFILRYPSTHCPTFLQQFEQSRLIAYV